MSDRRYGVYLRPSFAMCRAQAEIHDLLARQYGLRAAGRFMPHATIKGFFRSDAAPAALVAALDPALAGRPPFPISNRGSIPFGPGSIVLDVQHTPDGTRNAALHALHDAVFAAVAPVVHPACEFTPGEGAGARFFAHLTLAMADLDPALLDEVLAFLREAEPIGPAAFMAEVVQLWEFRSAAWDGAWWDTLDWSLLHSWRLSPALD